VKKVLFGVFAVCGVVYGADGCPDRTEDKSEYYDEKEAYSGAYIGAGLSYQHNNNHVSVSDNYADVVGASGYYNGADELSKEVRINVASVMRKEYPSAANWELNGKNKGKVGGSVSLGYGQFVKSHFYLGADFVLDITGNGESAEKAERVYKNTVVRNNGVVPTVALRVGGYIPGVDALVCARLGMAFVNTKAKNEFLDNELKIRKATPVVGLSAEKKIWQNFFVRVEGDYRFSAEKLKWIDRGLNMGIQNWAYEKTKTRSYCVRLMGVYRFN